ncbi:MAG: UDP-N-acetylglucosamine 1-carboxyvinyltransferase, partial [Clostridiales bacterium]|nr:UDP-N-acetylglucosamine 1-carboxyvinyltransferase [Clostridiales bacterium]
MGEYHIKGGRRICGEIPINGAKNAILPILASVVLNPGVSVIHNCPKISDTKVSVDILRAIGCKVNEEGKTLIIDAGGVNVSDVPADLVKEMRSSFIFLGGVLGRLGRVKICKPGGCELGERAVDLHLSGLAKLGVKVCDEDGVIECTADKITGCRINLSFPSVGATENLMLAGIYGEGETIISNAAKEPEIVDLQNFLNICGAKVKGAGTTEIVVTGVKKLHDGEYTVMPDRIVAGTYLVASAITNGEITLNNIEKEHLYPITDKLMETGCKINFTGKSVTLTAPDGRLKAIDELITNPHPGFPTDMQPQFVTLLSIASGTSIITETIFNERDKHIYQLKQMGAD